MPFTGHSTPSPHHKKEGTPSPPLPLPPPIPESTHQRYSLAPSSAPSTPYSHHPSQLFYVPPPSSPPSPVPVPAMPALPPTAYTNDERTSMRLSGYASSPDGSAFLARLPEGMEGVVGASTGAGVWRADGLDARVLAEMLAPRNRQGSASTKSGSSSGKGKGKKSKGGKSGKGKGKVEVDGSAGTVATPTATTSPSENFSTPTHSSAFASPELDFTDTPPPVPPKPLGMASTTPKSTHTTHTAHTGRTYSSYSHSSHSASITTEHAVATAQHATRAAASSHHLTGASLSSLAGIAAATPISSHTPTPLDGHRPESMYSYRSGMAAASDSSHRPSPSPSFSASHDPDPQRESQYLAKALASLPWAEPPPRQPSPLFPSPGVPGALLLPAVSGASASGTPPTSARTPTYSFLANDPVASCSAAGSHSRRSSASSTASRRAPSASAPPVSLPPIKVSSSQAHDALSSGVPVSPSLAGHSSEGGWGFSGMGAMQAAAGYRRFSAWSTSAGGSGDAAAAVAGPSGSKTDSPGSAMATQASSSSNPSRKLSSRSAKSAKSARFSFATATRTKSTKSTKSTRSTKRGSGSTLGHRFMGRWEVRKWEEIGEVGSAEGGEGEGSGAGRREKEETMDLRDLVGRAVVLERMLRHGRRVSAASLKRGYKESRFSVSSRFTPTPTPPIPTHHPSFSTASAPSMPSRPSSRARSRSAGPSKSKGRPSSQLPSPRKSMSTAAGGSGSGSGSRSGVRAKHGSMPASLRERIGRRLMRSRSREDVFTDLGSSGSGSGSDSGFSDEESGDEGMWAEESGVDTRGGTGKRGSRRVSRVVGAGAGASGEKGERGEERVGGKGVLVFPEEVEGPPTPPKDRPVKARVVPAGPASSGGLLGCTSPRCISPSSPTPLLSHLAHDPEKGLRHPQPGDSPDGSPTSSHASLSHSALGAKRYEQSPHLGHRSPDWRNRQSVLSYVSTKVWDPAVGPGATVWGGKGPGGRMRRKVLVLGLGAVVLVILIVGLLAGLLSKRGGQDE
ncbi:hypothetical protein IAT38_002210 [Cryptococcus sp. DSM 104549]